MLGIDHITGSLEVGKEEITFFISKGDALFYDMIGNDDAICF